MSEKINPIDPYELPTEEQDAYFEGYNEARWMEPQTPNSYTGSEKLLELIKDRVIGIGAVIRVDMFDSGNDAHYMVTPEGLVDAVNWDGRILTPEQALDNFGKPQWELSDHGFFENPY